PQLARDGALVPGRQFLVALAHPLVRAAGRGADLALDAAIGFRCPRLRLHARPVRARLRRARAGHVALPGSPDLYAVGSRRAALLAGLLDGRPDRAAAVDPGLYRVVVPRIPRQGPARQRLSLARAP